MIGVYDSSMGGLLLASMLARRFPSLPLLVYADTDGAPLQARSLSRIVEQAERGFRFLNKQGAQAVVVACHEASTLAIDSLRCLTAVPVVDIASVSAAAAARESGSGTIGILGSRTIVDHHSYPPLIKAVAPASTIISHSCPLLLPLIEEGWYNRVETKMIIKHCLRPLKDRQIDALLPASSLFQLVLPLLPPRVGRRTKVIDPFAELSAVLCASIETSGMDLSRDNGISPQICITRSSKVVEKMLNKFFGRRAVLRVL